MLHGWPKLLVLQKYHVKLIYYVEDLIQVFGAIYPTEQYQYPFSRSHDIQFLQTLKFP